MPRSCMASLVVEDLETLDGLTGLLGVSTMDDWGRSLFLWAWRDMSKRWGCCTGRVRLGDGNDVDDGAIVRGQCLQAYPRQGVMTPVFAAGSVRRTTHMRGPDLTCALENVPDRPTDSPLDSGTYMRWAKDWWAASAQLFNARFASVRVHHAIIPVTFSSATRCQEYAIGSRLERWPCCHEPWHAVSTCSCLPAGYLCLEPRLLAPARYYWYEGASKRSPPPRAKVPFSGLRTFF